MRAHRGGEEYDGVSGSGRWRKAVGIGARAVCVSQPVRRRADPWARWEQAVGFQSRNATGTLCMCVCVYGKVTSPSPGAGSFSWDGR